MGTRKIFPILTAAVFFAAFVMFSAQDINAQGRYANRYSKRDVSNIISRMESSSTQFRRDFDRAMDNSNLNGTQAEDRYNNIVRDFESSVNRLRRQFDRGDGWWESRNDVQNMVRDARPVNTMMTSISFRRNIERQWRELRNDVNTVADTYDLPGLEGGGWNGGGNNPGGNWPGGGQTSTPPNWAQGTFYSTYPNVRMTISRNGDVTSEINGQTFQGRYYRGSIYAGNEVATVTRSGDGFRTYNRTTGQNIDFRRGSGGWNPGGGGGGWEGPTSNPPSWAVGSFVSLDGNIYMTIDRNGRVTSEVDGQSFQGRYYNGSIYSPGSTATVNRRGNGLRTYNQTSGQNIDFRRR